MPRLLLLACWMAVSTRAEVPAADRAKLLSGIDANAAHYGEISRKIWEYAEVGLQRSKEFSAVARRIAEGRLHDQRQYRRHPDGIHRKMGTGQTCNRHFGRVRRAARAFAGRCTRPKASASGGPGHGCGHNLFGTASAFAAITVQQYMQANKCAARCAFTGTHAEEGGAARSTWRAPALSRTSTSCWHGIRAL